MAYISVYKAMSKVLHTNAAHHPLVHEYVKAHGLPARPGPKSGVFVDEKVLGEHRDAILAAIRKKTPRRGLKQLGVPKVMPKKMSGYTKTGGRKLNTFANDFFKDVERRASVAKEEGAAVLARRKEGDALFRALAAILHEQQEMNRKLDVLVKALAS